MSHVTNVYAVSENRQRMQYSDKNEHKKDKKALRALKTAWYT